MNVGVTPRPLRNARTGQLRDLRIGKPQALDGAHRAGIELLETTPVDDACGPHHVTDAREEPGVDPAGVVHVRHRPSATKRLGDVEDAVFGRTADEFGEAALVEGIRAIDAHARTAILKRAHGLAERLLEAASDRHDLADRLHAGGKRGVGTLELLEGETGRLHDAVVDRRLEAGGRRLRNVVHDLVERVSDRQPRRRLRDGKARRLRCERARTGHARVHLDHDKASVRRIDGELHVRAAGLDADALEDGKRCGAHALVLDVGQRLGGSDGDRVARMHAHRIEVLDRAHDNAVAGRIAHDLHFVFLPPLDALFDEHLACGRKLEALRDDVAHLARIVGDAAARAAERERGTEHHGISDRFGKGERIIERIGIAASSDFDADIGHGLGEELAILAGFDGGKVAADEFDAEALEHAGSRERHRGVQRRLAPYRGQERVGTLRLDNPLDEIRRDGLDIGAVHERRIGHDGGGIRIHEDDLVALG